MYGQCFSKLTKESSPVWTPAEISAVSAAASAAEPTRSAAATPAAAAAATAPPDVTADHADTAGGAGDEAAFHAGCAADATGSRPALSALVPAQKGDDVCFKRFLGISKMGSRIYNLRAFVHPTFIPDVPF